jgi:NAD(P)-dependent dehydrogenase (short-subunit alcohol dehydrogenase family)
MIAQGEGGAVVVITSIEAENPAPSHSHYNASKGGALMFTRAAASELGPHGIRVNAVAPGLMWTEGIEQGWPDGVARFRRAAPLGRLGMPEDVADACLFLCSPAARWITGASLTVDGGVMTHQVF